MLQRQYSPDAFLLALRLPTLLLARLRQDHPARYVTRKRNPRRLLVGS